MLYLDIAHGVDPYVGPNLQNSLPGKRLLTPPVPVHEILHGLLDLAHQSVRGGHNLPDHGLRLELVRGLWFFGRIPSCKEKKSA